MSVPLRCQARAVPAGSSAGNTGSSPRESRRSEVDADCGDIGQRYSTRRQFRSISRIGPELTDQRYRVWGAIRPTPVGTPCCQQAEKEPADVSEERDVAAVRRGAE